MRRPTLKGRKEALRLKEAQLQEDKKPNRLATTKERKKTPYIPLTPKDRERIQNEISVLKIRIES